ncbi:MAG: epoxyqueuosine reductase QueH [Chloroflexi bacterium]|nr:epoxyqueuosine reductase QueH [Chloroflexota bacterium]
MEKLLVHVCCCHCAAYTLKHFNQKYAVTAYWHNPNIGPSQEYLARKEAMQKYANIDGIDLVDSQNMDFESFLRGQEEATDRCAFCFYNRLKQSAVYARENGFTSFSTSLLISPHQKHELLKEIGRKIALEECVNFIYEDLRRYYSQSRTITKPLSLYAQYYCGCLFSKKEA